MSNELMRQLKVLDDAEPQVFTEYEAGMCAECGSENLTYFHEHHKLEGDMLMIPYACDDCCIFGREMYCLEFIDNRKLVKSS